MIHKITEVPWEITVATAAPWTPIFNWVIKTKSKIIFKTDETTKKTRGMTLLPMALINPAHKL